MAKRRPRRASLWKARSGLSSTARQRLAVAGLAGVALAGIVVAHRHHVWPAEVEAATLQPPQLSPVQESWYRSALGLAPSAGQAMPAADVLAEAIVRWKRLSSRGDWPFADYAGFLEAHPGWPGEAQLRKAAERAIDPDGTPPADIVAYFSRMAPTTNTGQMRYAMALLATGQASAAREAARAAWTGGALTAADEARLASAFTFTPAEQDAREDRLLWQRATAAAARQISQTSPGRRPVFMARLAFQQNDPNAAALAASAGVAGDADPGFLLDKAQWLVSTGHSADARIFLAMPHRLATVPLDPAAWLGILLDYAGGAWHDGDAVSAAAIARLAEQTYPVGVSPRDRPFTERDPYTSLVWTGGQAAMRANQPQEAERFFELYAGGARSPTTQSKGGYWAGRAALAAGDQAGALRFFTSTAAFYDQFYGQLAAERIGRTLAAPAPVAIPIPADRQTTFDLDERIRAARMLGELGDWADQSLFLRAIAQGAQDDVDHALIASLSRELGRPDLGVMVSRVGRANGSSDYVASGFPTVSVPAEAEGSWTMIHAISRQESQFDRMARSRVGATGVMQLMPATAREEAGKLGLAWDPSRLTDPSYNVELGAAFFGQLMDRYDGNTMLAVAAYNAGPGNVNKFIRQNGDPRVPGTDVVAWIEAIPFTETRGYVQHVLENAVVYDLMNPERARMPTTNRLSAYLGKQQPG